MLTAFSSSCWIFRDPGPPSAKVKTCCRTLSRRSVLSMSAKDGLAAARTSLDGYLKGLGETIRSGDQLQLTIRPQEATAALRQLLQACINYYSSVNDYNRAQFRLFHAIGHPAQRIAGDKAGLDRSRSTDSKTLHVGRFASCVEPTSNASDYRRSLVAIALSSRPRKSSCARPWSASVDSCRRWQPESARMRRAGPSRDKSPPRSAHARVPDQTASAPTKERRPKT